MSGSTGAEIGEIDLGGALSDATVAEIRGVLAEYGVVVFRNQALTPEQHIAVARRFGEININRFFAHADGYPEIALVSKEPDQTANIGGGWLLRSKPMCDWKAKRQRISRKKEAVF